MRKDARRGASFFEFSINLNFALRATPTLEGDGELALDSVGVQPIAVEVFAVAVVVFDAS